MAHPATFHVDPTLQMSHGLASSCSGFALKSLMGERQEGRKRQRVCVGVGEHAINFALLSFAVCSCMSARVSLLTKASLCRSVVSQARIHRRNHMQMLLSNCGKGPSSSNRPQVLSTSSSSCSHTLYSLIRVWVQQLELQILYVSRCSSSSNWRVVKEHLPSGGRVLCCTYNSVSHLCFYI